MSTVHRIKARRSLAGLLLLFLGLPFLLLLILEPGKKLVALGFLAFVLVFAGIAWLVLSKMWIEWDTRELRLHHILRTERLPWQDLVRSSTQWLPQGPDSISFNWYFELADGRTRFIQPGYYSRTDKQLLARTLIQQAPQAQIGNRVRAFAEGRFPWYLR
jgi:hypothetical protein